MNQSEFDALVRRVDALEKLTRRSLGYDSAPSDDLGVTPEGYEVWIEGNETSNVGLGEMRRHYRVRPGIDLTEIGWYRVEALPEHDSLRRVL